MGQIGFVSVVVTMIATGAALGLFGILTNKDSLEYFKEMLNEWKRKGGGR